jgi:sulfur-oxidizing protein SoxZ
VVAAADRTPPSSFPVLFSFFDIQESNMADPMRIRAALEGDTTTVRILMAHVMEPGTRKDASGALIPAHFIRDVEATHNGKSVLKAMFSGSVSQNPFLSFKFKGAAKGDKVAIKWVDTKGESRTDEVAIA